MIQTILVGLDWGETAEATASIAVELAIALDASVKALYIEEDELIRATERAAMATFPGSGSIPFDAPIMPELEKEFVSEERRLGRRFLKLVADTRIRGSFLVAQGEVDQILIRESRAHDLLVVGKYSERASEGSRIRPLGRHVERILRHIWCPVVLVPPGATLGPRILVAYDGSAGSHRALGTAVRLAGATQAELRTLVIGHQTVTDRLLAEVEAYLEAHRAESDLVTRTGHASEVILREAAEWNPDLLAMGAFGPARRRESFAAGVTLEVLAALPTAALLCGSMDED